AVLIDGRWHALDATLANTRFKKKGKLEVDGPRRDEWFLVPGGETIFTHYPLDPKGQLLDRPVTKKEHAAMPLLSPGAFRLGVQLWPHGSPNLAVRDSTVVRAKGSPGVTVVGVLAKHNVPVQGWVLNQRDPETGDTELYAV